MAGFFIYNRESNPAGSAELLAERVGIWIILTASEVNQ